MKAKKESVFWDKIAIDKTKDLWKALKKVGLPNKISSCEVSA